MSWFYAKTAAVNVSALNFPGTQTVMPLGNVAISGTAISIECWVRVPGVTDVTMRLIEKPHTSHADPFYLWGLQMHYNGFPRFDLSTGGTTFTLLDSTGLVSPCVVNTWYHLAATYDGTTMRLYRDSTQIASVGKTGSITSNSQNMVIGGHANVASEKLNGVLDEVRIWNVTRSQAEIAANMSALISPATAGLVGYWRCDENTGSTTADATGNLAAASLTSGVTFTTTKPF